MEEMHKIYTDVSEWLKFIEAKHAGLFAVWAAILIAVISSNEFWYIIAWKKTIVIVIILVGLLLNMVSFFPFLNNMCFIKRRCYRRYYPTKENSVFFQAIFIISYNEEKNESSIEKYRDILISRGITLPNNMLAVDYLHQIVDISVIAVIKTYLFEIAIKYIVSICIVFIILLIIA